MFIMYVSLDFCLVIFIFPTSTNRHLHNKQVMACSYFTNNCFPPNYHQPVASDFTWPRPDLSAAAGYLQFCLMYDRRLSFLELNGEPILADFSIVVGIRVAALRLSHFQFSPCIFPKLQLSNFMKWGNPKIRSIIKMEKVRVGKWSRTV